MATKQDEDSPWQYNPDGKEAVDDIPEDDSASAEAGKADRSGKPVIWQAPEFIAHSHPAGWYAGLFIATIALTALVFLITKDYIAGGTIVVLGIIIGLSAKRQPAMATYELAHTGLSINDKKYPYNSFKSFSLLRDGNMTSINFFPLKKFMPLVSAYLPQSDEDKVVKAIGNHLPYEQRQMDPIDRLSRRLRF